jgi:CubicO group peptidase (beta-lactamase class C family)
MYHTAAKVTGVLIARATGMSFGNALRERICEPLGMTDTAFSVGEASISRLATAHQRDEASSEVFDDIGWGFGMSVRTRCSHAGPAPGVSYPRAASVGSYGWPGVSGTGWYNDPAEDMTTILMIQRAPGSPSLPILLDFWTAAYQAIDD